MIIKKINLLLQLSALGMVSCLALSTHAETLVLLGHSKMVEFERQISEKIPNHTVYSWVNDHTANEFQVLEGVAEAAAAGMVYEHKVPINPNAVLEVTYKVVSASNPADEMTKAGDDFALRIYVTGKSFLIHKTLVMVHSLQYPVNTKWTSPYSSTLVKFEMYAFSGSETELNEWHSLEIPVGQLFNEAFEGDIDSLKAISFMVDSDNAGGKMKTRIARLVYRY